MSNFIELAQTMVGKTEEEITEVLKREFMVKTKNFCFRAQCTNSENTDYPSIDIFTCDENGRGHEVIAFVESTVADTNERIRTVAYSEIEEDDDYYNLTVYKIEE